MAAVPWELDIPDSEVVSVVPQGTGHTVWITSPESSCAGTELESHVALLEHRSGAEGGIDEVGVFSLGRGEVTSVAAHPGGEFAVLVQKDADRPDSKPGRVVFIGSEGILGSLPIGIGPDSIALSPDGDLALIACEAQVPDPEECSAEEGVPDSAGSIDVVLLRDGPRSARLLARVSGAVMHARAFRSAPERAPTAESIEPEFAAISPDGRTALVTLQEQSAVCILDLGPALAAEGGESIDPERVGARCLASIVFLPHDTRDAKGMVRGAHPDGVAISPDGRFAVTANEAHPRVREYQGVSILDLRAGPAGARLAATYSIFDLDDTLQAEGPARRASTKRAALKASGRANLKMASAAKLAKLAKGPRLPRLDPEGMAISRVGDRVVAALAIERRAPGEEAGSLLLLDVTRALDGERPLRIGRIVVGAKEDARPETLAFGTGGRQVFVASERDGGSLTVVEIEG